MTDEHDYEAMTQEERAEVETREGNREGCLCWGSNAIGHTDQDCPLG